MQKSQTTAEDVQVMAGRCHLYEFLSRVLEREADATLLDSTKQLAQLGLLDYNPAQPEDLEDLAVDYCRLFILPQSKLAPYQSVQSAENEYWGERASAMQNYLTQLGLTTAQGFMPDHAAIELAVMARLVQWEAEAYQEKAQAELQELRRLEADFYRNFLDWLPAYLERVQAYAQSFFYRTISRYGLTFLQAERAELGS